MKSPTKRRKRPQPLRIELIDALPSRAGDLDDINEAVGEVELDRIPAGLDPSPAGLVKNAPDLAEAPAEFSPWIVRDVPQEFA